MIPQRSISLLANRLAGAAGRRIQESVLERDYCLAWFLCGLADSDLKHALAFKGGTALKRCYFGQYRFSEDLDFTLREELTFEEIRQRLDPVFVVVRDASGIHFSFDREDRDRHKNSYTFYLRYSGPLPGGNDVKVDITLREKLAFPLEKRPVLRAYDEFSDLPEDKILSVYSLNEIAAEKTLALADPARNEPRDLYDLWYLTTHEGVELTPLVEAMRQKRELRGKPLHGILESIRNKEARLRALWLTRLAHQMAMLPEFDEVFRTVSRTLRQSDLP